MIGTDSSLAKELQDKYVFHVKFKQNIWLESCGQSKSCAENDLWYIYVKNCPLKIKQPKRQNKAMKFVQLLMKLMYQIGLDPHRKILFIDLSTL